MADYRTAPSSRTLTVVALVPAAAIAAPTSVLPLLVRVRRLLVLSQ